MSEINPYEAPRESSGRKRGTPTRHSRFGIVSVWTGGMSCGSLVAAFTAMFIAALGGRDGEFIGTILIVVLLLTAPISVISGLIGCLRPDRKRALAVTGLVLGSISAAFVIVCVIFAAVWDMQ